MNQSDPSIPHPTTLGQRVKAVRTAWGWSQKRLARVINLDQATVSFWEAEKIKPGGSSLLALSALFRVTPEALETGRGFVISDPPTSHPKKVAGNLRAVGLPVIPPSGTMIVDVLSGRAGSQDLNAMIMDLTEAVKAGRRLWMVVE